MDSNVNISDLQLAANVIVMKRHLRFIGITNVIVGIIFVILLSIFDAPLGRLYPLTIGVSFMAVGMLSITKPAPIMILMGCLPWAGLFVWSIILGKGFMGKIQVCLLTILYLNITIDSYLRFREKVPRKPTPKAVAVINSIIKDMERRDLSTSDDIFELSCEKKKWRVLLGEHITVFLAARRSEISVQGWEQDVFVLKSRNGVTHMVTVTSPATKDLSLEMPDEDYERYLAWKEHRVHQEGILS